MIQYLVVLDCIATKTAISSRGFEPHSCHFYFSAIKIISIFKVIVAVIYSREEFNQYLAVFLELVLLWRGRVEAAKKREVILAVYYYLFFISRKKQRIYRMWKMLE